MVFVLLQVTCCVLSVYSLSMYSICDIRYIMKFIHGFDSAVTGIT
jgi:hypothetical protein